MKLFIALIFMICFCTPTTIHSGMVVGNYYSGGGAPAANPMTITLGANDIIGLGTNDKIVF